MSLSRLYLDTARLGLMSPSARQAIADFTQIGATGEVPFTLYFDRFLKRGVACLPFDTNRRYPGLACWKGLPHLKKSLSTLAGTNDHQVLLASRSKNLVRLGIRRLFQRCRRVLLTDLTWPGYWRLLTSESKRSGSSCVVVKVRARLLSARMSAAELSEHLYVKAQKHRVDGLFLPAVSHEGLGLPIAPVCRRIREKQRLQVMIDGAQEFCQRPSATTMLHADYYVAGCHKWLGAYLPMGIAFHTAAHSRPISRLAKSVARADPILRLSQSTRQQLSSACGETINFSPLLACAGAVSDALERGTTDDAFALRVRYADTIARRAGEHGWQPLQPDGPLRTGILLLQSTDCSVQQLAPATLEQFFLERGIASTTYHDGVLRLSMPSSLRLDGIELLVDALQDCAAHFASVRLGTGRNKKIVEAEKRN